MKKLVLGLTLAALAGPLYAQGDKPLAEATGSTPVGATGLPRCAHPLATISIVDPDGDWWSELNLESPKVLLESYVRQSGCFTVINYGQGLQEVQQERARENANWPNANREKDRVKRADFILSPRLVEPLSSSPFATGSLGGLLSGIGNFRSKNAPEAKTSLSMVKVSTTEQVNVTTGSATRLDLNKQAGNEAILDVALARTKGSYLQSERGRIIAQSYLNAFSDLVAQVRSSNEGNITKPQLGAYAPGTRAPDVDTPFIPWPPPRPSSLADVSARFTKAPTYGGFDRQIGLLLANKGYRQRFYFKVPGGFGMTTEVERIRPDGQPDKMRWSSTKVPARGSWVEYIKALFMGDTGRFRMFVFIVSDVEPMPSNVNVQAYQVKDWTHTGRALLSRAASSASTSKDTRVWLLVYEFINSNSKDQALIADNEHSLPFSTHAHFLGIK